MLVVPHFYRSEEKSIYSSRSKVKRAQRRRAIYELVYNWRALCQKPFILDIERKAFVSSADDPISLDIFILLHSNDHLLEKDFVKKNHVKLVVVKTTDPMMLPFGAHHLLSEKQDDYDWFIYSEDDLIPRDPFFFQKQMLFRSHFGEARLLQPNRYEFNPDGPSIKTYIDGNLRGQFIEPFFRGVDEQQEQLEFDYAGQSMVLMRARNPHSGFFMLSGLQMKAWASSETFLDMDCSFISPLESAATLGILKTFSIFKPSASNLSFLEIEHLDGKYSGMKFPLLKASN